ncbi:MAG TPA: PilZ domain-containing protein [Candidatus Polarisedimenticolia bacterium]|nr:PilZ domain-containing protein [Candidatus Polarisedimenticolia bacterium]
MRTLHGRIDKRLPIAVVVYLSQAQDRTVKESELTCTDNISVNGARVISRRPWQTGELVQLTPLKDEASIRGKVVYCQKLEDDRYLIGLNIQGLGASWPAFRTYSGA